MRVNWKCTIAEQLVGANFPQKSCIILRRFMQNEAKAAKPVLGSFDA